MAIPHDYENTRGGTAGIMIALGILAVIVIALVMLARPAGISLPDVQLSAPPPSLSVPNTAPAPVPAPPAE